MIREIEILAADLQAIKTFYGGILELQALAAPTGYAAFQVGETKLIFRETSDMDPYYHLAIDIPHNKLYDAYHWMQNKAALLPVQHETVFTQFMNWNAQSFYFFDRNGNLLEFICRYDVPNSSTQQFSSRSFQYVSEIGIVTNNVMEQVKELGERYGLQPYEKQPVLENFAAVGDEEGLLIVSMEGRNWFPTEKPAGRFFTRVVMDDAARKGRLELFVN
ncbi:VOC family protein [Longitalea luteola]|uniref:VOC family protein n=1 Tax=Longitalea luteola TaxID=2812563 RepID=UPI001A968F38|nr:hypothetical protein [Longitalea luteola]